MAESTVGSSTKGEVLVEFLDRPKKPAVKSVPLTGMASGRTDRGMRQGSGFKPPEVIPVGDYMGLAFDASVRKGKDAARAYLLAKMKRDGRSETICLLQNNNPLNQTKVWEKEWKKFIEMLQKKNKR